MVVARTISEVSAWTSGPAATAASDLAVATAYVFGAGEGATSSSSNASSSSRAVSDSMAALLSSGLNWAATSLPIVSSLALC